LTTRLQSSGTALEERCGKLRAELTCGEFLEGAEAVREFLAGQVAPAIKPAEKSRAEPAPFRELHSKQQGTRLR